MKNQMESIEKYQLNKEPIFLWGVKAPHKKIGSLFNS
jgi:hypothetical protein